MKKKKILEKIKITPEALKENFDITIFEDIEYSFMPLMSHKEVVKELADKDPFLITVIIETLKPEYWRKKKYAKQTRVTIPSRYTEFLYQYFFEEHGKERGNKIYAGWLKKYRSRWKKEGKKREIDNYIIENELEARYKNKILGRYKNIQKLKKSRFKIRKERYYHLSPPLNRVDWRNPYDNIFIWHDNGHKFARRGGSGSSGQREINSRFAFGLSLINHARMVSSYLFLYSDENRLFFIKKFQSLCLPAYDIGSNYFLSSDEEDKVLKGTNFLRWEALFKVDEITIEGGAWIENTK